MNNILVRVIQSLDKISFTFKLKPTVVFLVFCSIIIGVFGITNFFIFQSYTGALIRGFTVSGQILLITSLLVLAISFGRFLLSKTSGSDLSTSIEWAVALGLGMTALGFGTSMLAATGRLQPFTVYGMLFFVAYLSRHELLNLLKVANCRSIELPFSIRTWWIWTIWSYIITMFGFELIGSMATILRADYDALHQYLTFPMEYLVNGGFTIFLWHPNWGSPQLGETFFLLAGALAGVTGPFLLNFAFMAILVSVVFQVGKNKITPSLRHWLAASLASSPTIIGLGAGALKIELIFYFYCLLILLLVRHALIQDYLPSPTNHGIKILLGIFLGTILSMKYTALFIVATLLITVLILGKNINTFMRFWFGIISLAGLIFLPWLLRNWVVYRSPFYPLFRGQDPFAIGTGEVCGQYFTQYAAHDVILLHAKYFSQTGIAVLDNFHILWFSITHIIPFHSILSPGIWILPLITISFRQIFFHQTVTAYEKFLLLFSVLFFTIWTLFLIGGTWYLFPVWLALLLFVSNRALGRYELILLSVVAIVSLSAGWTAALQSTPSSLWFINGDQSLQENLLLRRGSATSVEMYNYTNSLLAKDPEAKLYSFQNPIGYFIHDSSKKLIIDYYGERLSCLYKHPNEVKNALDRIGVKYILADTWRQDELCSQNEATKSNKICQSLMLFQNWVDQESLPIIRSDGSMTLYELK